jgi:excisionase family DNA binding protein
MGTAETEYLTIPEVAQRLGMTPDGAYKLIQRGKLEAVRLSERKLRVPVAAFDRYTIELQRRIKRDFANHQIGTAEELRRDFIAEVGPTPEAWLAAWKRDEIEETLEALQILVRATVAHSAALTDLQTDDIAAYRATSAHP